jgi:segregation and condensation protein A
MFATPTTGPALDACQLRLPTFEGPLDVLLRLIERDQLAIDEISLLAVLDQFLMYMDGLAAPPPHVIAEFAAVACRLSVLKSRALLPKPAKPSEDPDEFDLVRQLEEYRSLKRAAALLFERQLTVVGGFGRGDGIEAPSSVSARFPPQAPIVLATAVTRWIRRLPQIPAPLRTTRIVTLREMVSRITRALEGNRTVAFEDCVACGTGKQEIAVAFLAVLTLMRRQVITVVQPELFGRITLTRTDSVTDFRSMSDSVGSAADDEQDRLLA